jgi:hypothetical protein
LLLLFSGQSNPSGETGRVSWPVAADGGECLVGDGKSLQGGLPDITILVILQEPDHILRKFLIAERFDHMKMWALGQPSPDIRILSNGRYGHRFRAVGVFADLLSELVGQTPIRIL